ncbi:MAG: alpha/beta hydrolase [Candidatus Cryptobacteroides sp.]|nr:alpha/beta hydrolase [Bacteroidales bacterium]
MKRTLLILSLCALSAAMPRAFAAEPYSPNTKLRPTVTRLLYPEGQNVDKGIVENGTAVTLGPGVSNGFDRPEEMEENGNISYIGDEARIDIYLPSPKKRNGQMVVVCPGGGYWIVSSFNEGAYVADWFTKQGIAVCVVKYRLPNGHWEVPLNDVQNAFRYCRAHAGEWGVNKIGVIGFSAGGHLAASASTLYIDEITRPDFSILVYPVISMDPAITHKGTHDNLIGKISDWVNDDMSVRDYARKKDEYNRLMDRYSLHKQVNGNTPPAILLLSGNDKTVPVENSLLYYDALRENKVKAQLYIYPYGGHGWGFTTAEFGKERIGIYRQLFFDALKAFLSEIQ